MEFDQVSAEMDAALEDAQRQHPGAKVEEPFIRGYQRGREHYQQMCDEKQGGLDPRGSASLSASEARTVGIASATAQGDAKEGFSCRRQLGRRGFGSTQP